MNWYDFSRICRRADGSVYGTAGQCRKGVEITRPEDKEAYIRRLNSGKDDRSPSEIEEADRLLYESVKDMTNFESRLKKLTDKGLTEAEGCGVLAWISKDYPRINKSIYSDEKDEWAEAAAFRAAQGLRKLPKFNLDELEATDPRWTSIRRDGKATERGTLTRGVNIPWDKMDSFLAETYPEGSEITSSMFMGSTGMTAHSFLKRSSVLINIKHKTDGSTSAVTVDEFKSKKFEAEAIYPPGTRFRVASVERGNRVVNLNLPSQVRDRFPPSIADDPESMLKLSRAAEWNVAMAKTKSENKKESLMRKLEREREFLEENGLWDMDLGTAQEFFAIFFQGNIVEEITQQSVVTLEEL